MFSDVVLSFSGVTFVLFLKKNMNASKPSKLVKRFRWEQLL